MKRVRNSLIVLGMLMFASAASGQCGGDEFLDECASSLGTYTFIKAFNVEINPRKTEKVEFSYVFSNGSNYMIINCDEKQAGNRVIVTLYDRNHNLVASSYNEKTKKHYPDLVYPCTATGVYYLEAKMEGDGAGCGVVILGFSK
ncbi:MAG: hypothetical protein R2751_10490 [Bacteroidales bacterium]